MGIGDLIVVALSGYVFITNFALTRVQKPRWAGYEMLFACGVAGILLLFLSYPLAWFSKELFESIWPSLFHTVQTIWPANVGLYTAAAVLGIPIALLLARLFNLRANLFREEKVRKLAASGGNRIEVLLCDAIDKKRSVELSLESGKSYVGFALRTSYPTHGIAKDIELVPFFSGYRDEHTQALTLDRFYGEHIVNLLETGYEFGGRKLVLNDLKVVIPARQVVSARFFDYGIYLQLNPDHSEASSNSDASARSQQIDRRSS